MSTRLEGVVHLMASAARMRIPGLCIAAALAAAALAGCASVSRVPIPPESQEALLRALPAFSLSGRTSVRAGEEGFQASLSWNQRGEETVVRLSGPFGAGALTVTWRPGELRLASGRGEVYENAAAEQVLLEQLGFVPPFESLRHWVLGLEAPGEPAAERTVGDNGRLAELTQQLWRIRYDRWMNAKVRTGAIQMPRLLTVTRDQVRLRVVVEKWRL